MRGGESSCRHTTDAALRRSAGGSAAAADDALDVSAVIRATSVTVGDTSRVDSAAADSMHEMSSSPPKRLRPNRRERSRRQAASGASTTDFSCNALPSR